MTLSKEDLAKINDLVSLTVNVPEWGGDVLVKQLDVTERLIVEDLIEAKDKEFSIKVVAMSLIDDKGNQLFTPDELKKRNGKVVLRLFREILNHNTMSSESIEDAKKN